MTTKVEVPARLVRGHGVASGQGGDPRYPDGTLALQAPLLRARGVALADLRLATLNLCVAPRVPEWGEPRWTVRQLYWSPYVPPEDFSFYPCRVRRPGAPAAEALVYRPHPETKPEHEQPVDVIEVLAPDLGSLAEGALVHLAADPATLRFRRRIG